VIVTDANQLVYPYVRRGAHRCEYVALAEALDVPLVTEDREVLRAFPARAVSPEQFVKIG
jgi:hypothetical protein